jgi:hypothetical protein
MAIKEKTGVRTERHLTDDFSSDLEYNMLKEDGNIKWYLKPVSVVLLLFFVLGPVGLPPLYKSPKFSKALKPVLTLVVIVYKSCLIFASLQIAKELYMRMEELQDT